MRKVLAIGCALLITGLARLALPCGGEGKGGCDWFNPHVTFSLTEGEDGLVLSTLVEGCEGMRAAHQGKIEEEIAKARRGEACPGCPFGVEGLSYEVERTSFGVVVRIKGPAEKLTEFRNRFEQKMEAREKGGSGCGCSAHGADSKKSCVHAGQ